MSEHSGFFNAKILENGSYDRVYLAENFADYFASFVGNGVFAKKMNSLQILADTGMNIKVKSGQAWINGYWYENDSDLILSVATAPTTGYRVDSVVLRYGVSDRTITCVVKQGSQNVANPTPIRNSEYYELVLANIKVNAGKVSISSADIVDKRGDNSVCGFVTGVIDQIDTTDFYTQLNGWLESFISKTDEEYSDFTTYLNSQKNSANSNLTAFEGDLNTLKATATTEINSLIEEIRGLLDGDVATNLQNQVDKKMNAPTSEIMTNQRDFIPSIGYKLDGTIDIPTVKYISVLNAGVGRLLARGRGGQGLSSIPYIDIRSMFDGTNPFEHDKINNSLSKNSQYLVPGTEYNGPDCMVDAATWSKIKEMQENQLTYMYTMSLMSLEGTPFERLNQQGQGKSFIFPGEDNDGNAVFSGYRFEILFFRNIQNISDLKSAIAKDSLYDIGVITSLDLPEQIGMGSQIVPSLFGNLYLNYDVIRASDTGRVTVTVYIDSSSGSIDENEYVVSIKKFPAISPYSSDSQYGNWIKDLGVG